jgi:hypothetical protein
MGKFNRACRPGATDAVERTQAQLNELLPWNWTEAQAEIAEAA